MSKNWLQEKIRKRKESEETQKEIVTIEVKIKALDELLSKSAKYSNSQEYFKLLKFINGFPKLSPFNAFLIFTQNSAVDIVLSAAKWARYGRRIKYNSRPLVILIPFGPVDFVYDIADTEGDKNIPPDFINPFFTSGKLNPNIYHKTVENCKKENIIVSEYDMKKGSAGYAQTKTSAFKISINNSYQINEKYSTIVHELAHIFCGHLGVDESSWWKNRSDLNNKIAEIEAESISFLVCKRRGLKTSSEKYLSNYITNEKTIPPLSLDTVLTVSGYIEQMGEKGFKSKRKKAKT